MYLVMLQDITQEMSSILVPKMLMAMMNCMFNHLCDMKVGDLWCSVVIYKIIMNHIVPMYCHQLNEATDERSRFEAYGAEVEQNNILSFSEFGGIAQVEQKQLNRYTELLSTRAMWVRNMAYGQNTEREVSIVPALLKQLCDMFVKVIEVRYIGNRDIWLPVFSQLYSQQKVGNYSKTCGLLISTVEYGFCIGTSIFKCLCRVLLDVASFPIHASQFEHPINGECTCIIKKKSFYTLKLRSLRKHSFR